MSRLSTKQRRAREWRREFHREWVRLQFVPRPRDSFTAADLAEWSVAIQRDPPHRGGLGRLRPVREGETTP